MCDIKAHDVHSVPVRQYVAASVPAQLHSSQTRRHQVGDRQLDLNQELVTGGRRERHPSSPVQRLHDRLIRREPRRRYVQTSRPLLRLQLPVHAEEFKGVAVRQGLPVPQEPTDDTRTRSPTDDANGEADRHHHEHKQALPLYISREVLHVLTDLTAQRQGFLLTVDVQ